jgi:hypothetical protein
MQKVVPLTTRALGAEPGTPDLARLTGWVAEHRGTAADLHAYRLDESLAPQISSGIIYPCAGGLFCRDRVRESLTGLNMTRDRAIGDIHVDTGTLADDATLISSLKKECWCALPTPLSLGITDEYYRDKEEWCDAITTAYRSLMRAMRDAGIGGHVLIGETSDELEISLLAGKKVFFFVPDPQPKDLETLMEHQRQVAINTRMLESAIILANEYAVNQWIVMDPDERGIRMALSHFDPDQVIAGGYCTNECNSYWERLTNHSVYRK